MKYVSPPIRKNLTFRGLSNFRVLIYLSNLKLCMVNFDMPGKLMLNNYLGLSIAYKTSESKNAF